MDVDEILTDTERRTRVFFASTAFVLLSVIIIALVFLAIGTTTAATATLGINGVGRALPLVFLPVFGILGVNALAGLLKRKEAVDTFIGWSLIALASFIIVNGVFGHLWYEGGVFHEGLNMDVERLGEADIPIQQIELKAPFVEWGYAVNFALTLGVGLGHWWKNERRRTRGVGTAFVVFLLWGLMPIPVGIKGM